ncbi:MAG: hypothetical protein SOZ80_00685 [Prevotella sp.]|uniref:hypothetical protein n=1 Tax=Prevotella sp. TaxID=59823 RepID=UPI002A345C0F|nr:hypothetical protein [Prevotella sp.]MDD7318904.1 hypothetical protein [Prevotellaceae bacterium]MDY4019283.1 hypothetical protein [Prevotella sp.]
MRILIVVLSLLLVAPTMAQKGKKRSQNRKVVAEKEKPTAGQLMFDNMLASTRRVMIIDSMVVDKSDFLSKVPLPAECGKLSGDGKGAAFQNDFINKKYFSKRDTSGISKIYTTDFLAGQWTKPQELSEIGYADYPFLMIDGTTLYFSAEGEASLGGYDIFVTRYDADSGSFLEPQNIGLPFNSFANDYLYAEDETDSLAWLVTDRNQSDDKVCIYTLVPDTHSNYDVAKYSTEALKRLATISSIKDTWVDKTAREAAQKRLNSLNKESEKSNRDEVVSFVVNDRLTYTSIAQFKSPTNVVDFKKLQVLTKELEANYKELEDLRDRFSSVGVSAQRRMAEDILTLEQKVEKQERDKYYIEKSIRNTENLLTK